MYIWRRKNRRDKRHELLLGEAGWTAGSEDKDHRVEDEELRERLEEQHIKYFRSKVEQLMTRYLDTAPGEREVVLLRRELELYRRNQEDLLRREERLAAAAEETKKSLKLLFRQFGDAEYEEIDRKGLISLLQHLKVTMSEKEFDAYAERCGFIAQRQSVTFEEFYHEFLEELKEREKRSVWSKIAAPFLSLSSSLSLSRTPQRRIYRMADLEKEEETERTREKGVSVSWFLELRLQAMEAKALLVEHAVFHAEKEAKREFRKAHPPLLVCLECDRAFSTDRSLAAHSKDKDFHAQFLHQRAQQEEKFIFVDKLLSGDLARSLKAQRLIFSEELGAQEMRADFASPSPFRPSLSDPEGKRHTQLLRGMFVTGFDPKSGVRSNYTHYGLAKQHLAAMRTAPSNDALLAVNRPLPPVLMEVITELMRCQDHCIDTVSCQDQAPKITDLSSESSYVQWNNELNSALVRFAWNGFADHGVDIIGEFTAWRAQPMHCDTMTNRFIFEISLSPGRYLYRFIVDGTERVDAQATQIVDANSPIGCSNELLVTQGPAFHAPHKALSRSPFAERKRRQAQTQALSSQPGSGLQTPLTARSRTFSWDELDTRTRTDSFYTDGTQTPTSTQTPVISTAPHTLGEIIHISRIDKRSLVRQVNTLALRNLSLCDDGLNALLAHIHPNSYVRELDLSYNSLSDEGIQSLALALPKLAALHTLKLNGNGFGYDGVRYLVRGLKESLATSRVITYNRESNAYSNANNSTSQRSGKSKKKSVSISAPTAAMLTQQTNTATPSSRRNGVRVLELANNRIGDDGCEVLCAHLQYDLCVHTLRLDANYLGDDALQCIADTLLLNRTLTTLSLGTNRFTHRGVDVLARALRRNASLTELSLAENAIGADAVAALSETLFFTTTLASLNLSRVSLLSQRSQRGVLSLSNALKTNRSLTHLSLSHNGINDDHAEFLSDALSANETLTSLDLSYNSLRSDWFVAGRTILSRMRRELPAIETSLARNRVRRDAHENAFDVDPRRYIVDDVVRGQWTTRREWHAVTLTRQAREVREKIVALEHERMRAEREHVERETQRTLQPIALYLREAPCKEFIHTLAQAIASHLKDLANFDVHTFSNDGEDYTALSHTDIERAIERELDYQRERDRERRATTASSMGAREREKSIKLKHARDRDPPSPQSHKHTLPKSYSQTLSPSDSWSEYAPQSDREKESALRLEAFMHTHIAVVHAVLLTIESDRQGLLLHPERLQQALQMLALPLSPSVSFSTTAAKLREKERVREELQNCVDACIVPQVNMLALHKLSAYLLLHARRWSAQRRLQRLRVLADLSLHPPLQEAQVMVLSHYRAALSREIRAKYRATPGNEPKYVCAVCDKRFASETIFEKHKRRGDRNPHHKRQRLRERVLLAQSMLLHQVKRTCSGVFFPAYFELLPDESLPRDYFPQLLDCMGQRGRPFAVAESGRTIRALDVLGDFLLVSHASQRGWIRFQTRPSFSLSPQPCLRPIPGFDWESLRVQERETYFRVNENLPPEIELKVRYRPALDADVVGYVKKGEMIRCFAEIGDWLQVQFHKEDAVWLLRRSPLDSIIAAKNLATEQVVEDNASPVRRRRVDRSVLPQGEVDDDEDAIFKDAIVTYEIDGRRVRHNCEKDPSLSRYKVSVFDALRYGGPQQSSDHLLRVPEFVLEKSFPAEEELQNLPSPSPLSQRAIFDAVVASAESELRAWESVERGDVCVEAVLQPWGRSMRDNAYAVVTDDEDLRAETDDDD